VNDGVTTGVYRDLKARAAVLSGALTIGAGTPVLKVLSATATLDFPSVAASGQQTLDDHRHGRRRG
jgi:hypothetical protein